MKNSEKNVVKYSVIVPVYKDKDIALNAILSLARQFKASKEEHKQFSDWTLELVIVNDSPDTDMSCLKRTFDKVKAWKDWTCKYLVMPSNQGEGNARRFGINHCSGDYFFLMDADDVFGPNVISRCNEVIVQETSQGKKISMVEFPFTSFDVGYTNVIDGFSIWQQSKCYNKEFILSHNIESTDLSSRAGADYNFVNKAHLINDYYDRTTKEWERVIVNREQCYTWSYWFPSNSQTRSVNYWGDWICPKTVLNGIDIVKFVREFEETKGETITRREYWKSDILNKACYNFINLHSILRQCTVNEDFIKKVTSIDNISGEDNNIVFYDLFKKSFIETADLCREYIDEIWDMTIWTTFEGVWNRSDCHKCMPWFDFRQYIENPKSLGIFDFNNMKELIGFCKENYKFDANGYPLMAKQYKAFMTAMDKYSIDK